jgi:hypothetical protein
MLFCSVCLLATRLAPALWLTPNVLHHLTGTVTTVLGSATQEGYADGSGADARLTSGSVTLACRPDGSMLLSDIQTKMLRLITITSGPPAGPSPAPGPTPTPAPAPAPARSGGLQA